MAVSGLCLEAAHKMAEANSNGCYLSQLENAGV